MVTVLDGAEIVLNSDDFLFDDKTTKTDLFTAAASPKDHESFGRFTIVGQLGDDETTEVELGVSHGQAGFQKLVVIKRLHGHLEDSPEYVERFRNEARLGARLDHPNCVQTLEVGQIGGRHFIAREYLSGQSLARLMRLLSAGEFTLPPSIACQIVVDVLEGLSYLHDLTDFDGRPLNTVQGGPTPDDIFVTYHGAVKLLGFGGTQNGTRPSQTKSGIREGRFAYMAPERIAGAHADKRADLFGLSTILWEALAHRRLFDPENDAETLRRKVSRTELDAPSAVQPNLPKELDEIVLRGLAYDPNNRFQNAAELCSALCTFMSRAGHSVSRIDIADALARAFPGQRERDEQSISACVEGTAQIVDRPAASSMLAVDPQTLSSTTTKPSRKRLWVTALLLLGAALAAAFATFGLLDTPDSPAEVVSPPPVVQPRRPSATQKAAGSTKDQKPDRMEQKPRVSKPATAARRPKRKATTSWRRITRRKRAPEKRTANEPVAVPSKPAAQTEQPPEHDTGKYEQNPYRPR